MLEVDRAVEALEQPLATAQEQRRDSDRQLVDVVPGQSLSDDVGAAHDLDVLVARRLAGPADGIVEVAHELEAGVLRCVVGGIVAINANGRV